MKMSREKYLIIADDFTGASDTGVQLKKNGYQAEIQLFPTGGLVDHSVVLDTESRTISPVAASRKVAELVKKITEKNQFNLVYKKIDSTIRGNIGEEIHAISDLYQPDLIVVAPALPNANRTTINGIQMLGGKPLMATDITNDPLNPLWTDNIVELLQKEFGRDVELVSLKTNKRALPSKAKVLVFDAETDSDLEAVVASTRAKERRILYVGSAGLASVLFKKSKRVFPSLAVVGSISETSLSQMEYAAENGISIVTIQLNDLLKPDSLPLISKYQELVHSSLSKGDTILTVTRKKEDYQKTIEAFESLGTVDRSEISRIVRENLAAIASEVVKAQRLSGLFLTGGDTAIEMIRALGASGSEIQEEITPGVVLGTLIGGIADGLKIVTKAGAFGQQDTLLESMKRLSGGE